MRGGIIAGSPRAVSPSCARRADNGWRLAPDGWGKRGEAETHAETARKLARRIAYRWLVQKKLAPTPGFFLHEAFSTLRIRASHAAAPLVDK